MGAQAKEGSAELKENVLVGFSGGENLVSTKASAVEGSVSCRPVRLPKRNLGFRKKGWREQRGKRREIFGKSGRRKAQLSQWERKRKK